MASIEHKIGILARPERVYEALTKNSELSEWWTTDTKGAGDVGSVIQFRFNGGGPDFRVTRLEPNSAVEWTFNGGGPEAWGGTVITFFLREEGNQTFVRFRQEGWKEAGDFFAHCCTKWAVFLLSLKDWIETGVGKPFPSDIPIDHS